MMPLVSISCITFNHAPFIKECFEGFLIQKTNFAFEILVHDDASTDGTKEILEEYTAKYPDLFFPIYQKENQYSKGIKAMNPTFNYPRARGKYIALCEGDDYWTDPYKLQKQVDFLEANEEYTLVAGNSLLIDEKGAVIRETISKEGPIHLKQILKKNILGSATASLFFRKDCLDSKYSTLTSKFPFGDWLLSAYCISKGKGYILKDVLSAGKENKTKPVGL
jgi:glycosyltransferase involved in cell wall biosynthesis